MRRTWRGAACGEFRCYEAHCGPHARASPCPTRPGVSPGACRSFRAGAAVVWRCERATWPARHPGGVGRICPLHAMHAVDKHGHRLPDGCPRPRTSWHRRLGRAAPRGPALNTRYPLPGTRHPMGRPGWRATPARCARCHVSPIPHPACQGVFHALKTIFRGWASRFTGVALTVDDHAIALGRCPQCIASCALRPGRGRPGLGDK